MVNKLQFQLQTDEGLWRGIRLTLVKPCSSLGHYPTFTPKGLCPWDSLGKNTGIGGHFLLQGMLPTWGWNPQSLMSPVLAGGFFTTRATWEVRSLLLLLSRFSRVRLCMTPQTAVHQAPPALGFFRQEHWSGLPFPSPVHESEKWKWSRSVMSDPQQPHGLQPSMLLQPWDFPGKCTGVGCHCLLQCLLQKPINT